MSAQADATGRWYRITPLDSWFFRESRPHGAAGGSELASLFPPPARTVAGAIRTFIGEHAGVDWKDFKEGKSPLNAEIGHSGAEKYKDKPEFGQLKLSGPYLHCGKHLLLPAPLFLLECKDTEKDKGKELTRLQPAVSAIECDLGNVRLPVIAEPVGGEKQLDSKWIQRAGFVEVLSGGTPKSSELINSTELLSREGRLGIARDYSARSAAEGLLYQTQHLRLTDGVSLLVRAAGIDGRLFPTERGLLRFGGEGRLAEICPLELPETPPEIPSGLASVNGSANEIKGIVIVLVTDALLCETNGQHCSPPGWLPANFDKQQVNGADVWSGELCGVKLHIISAVLGKARREGGWDVAGHKPRPVRSLIPAGSAWFCETSADADAAVRELHGCRIGEETEIGRGEIAAGIWK